MTSPQTNLIRIRESEDYELYYVQIQQHGCLFLHTSYFAQVFFIVCSYSRQFVFPISGNYLDYYRLMATTPRLVAIPFSDALALSYL